MIVLCEFRASEITLAELDDTRAHHLIEYFTSSRIRTQDWLSTGVSRESEQELMSETFSLDLAVQLYYSQTTP